MILFVGVKQRYLRSPGAAVEFEQTVLVRSFDHIPEATLYNSI
jgi:hypothetical protein